MSIKKIYKVDKLKVLIFDNRENMGRNAGHQIAECIRKMLKEKEELNIIFAAAPSQNETLKTLCLEDNIDWSCINAYHMDEYVGLDEENPAGFRNYLKRTIFDILPFKSVQLINGNARDVQKEAMRYSELLKKNPVDICLLGVGENGHLAFNDPPVADFNDPVFTKVVKLDEKCRTQQVHDGCFKKIEEVPEYAITVTIPGLIAAKHMFCSVPAITKAEAVKMMLNGTVTEKCPASILTTHKGATLYLDVDSAKYLF